MKDKILTLIIGILIGAILTAGGFLIYNNVSGSSSNNKMNEMHMMNKGERPEIPNERQIPNGEMPEGNASFTPDNNQEQGNRKMQNNGQQRKETSSEKVEEDTTSTQKSSTENNV